MIESTGYYINATEERKIVQNEQQEKDLKTISDATYQNKIPPKLERLFAGAQTILEQEFNYYSFAAKINMETSNQIIANVYPKTLEA